VYSIIILIPKIVEVFAKILEAEIKTPQNTNPCSTSDYDLVGFGAGIDSEKHYKPLLDLADACRSCQQRAFIFFHKRLATKEYMQKCHTACGKNCKPKVTPS
jgi:hypothetical protein